MSARKRGDTWYARFQINGRRIERPAGPRRADAIALETKIRAQAVDQRVGRHQDRLIDDAIVRWLEGDAKTLKDLAGLKAKLRTIRPYTKGQPLSAAANVAESIKREMLKEGLTPATINRRLAALRRVVNLAVEWEWAQYAPKIKLLAGEEARTVMLTEAQVKKLAMAAAGPVRDAIMLGAYTGMREGEILRLTRDQVVGDTITLTKTKSGRQRSIPTPQQLAPILAKVPLDLTYAQLRTGFEDARTAAKMPHVQFRDLRRSYGSWILQRTGNLKAVQDLLGHSTIAITARHYAHLLTDHLRDAVSTLNQSAVGQNPGKTARENPGPKAKKLA